MGFVQKVPTLAIALLILLVTMIVARSAVRIADWITRRSTLREDLKKLIDTLVKLSIWIVGGVIALTIMIPSFTLSSAVAGLGIGAIAIGFAFQDIFENFLAGVVLAVRDKMNVGDTIEAEGILGKVEKTSLRETHIRQLSNELTIVPNSLLFKNPVKILTDDNVRRNEVIVGVSYDADLEQAQSVILDAVNSVEAVNNDRPPIVYAQEFNASSIDFLVQWWAKPAPRDLRETKSEVVIAVKKALDQAGIEIPFPQVTTTVRQQEAEAGSSAADGQA